MATSDAHISIGLITLIVKNLNIVSDFYRQKIAFEVISNDATTYCLGQGDKPLAETIHKGEKARADTRMKLAFFISPFYYLAGLVLQNGMRSHKNTIFHDNGHFDVR